MQGRLSPKINNLIQAFPVDNWRQEFVEANSIGMKLMEWTLDYKDIYLNPIMHEQGRDEILELSKKHKISIPSLTGDCFMQMPFWKESNVDEITLKKIFIDVLKAASKLGIQHVVIPIVDNGKLESKAQEELLLSFLLENIQLIKSHSLNILFESDLDPINLQKFIKQFPQESFGINYDIGNSASLGYDPKKEFEFYGQYVRNVHVKDRRFKGDTVFLGRGDANFKLVYENLKKISYKGNFILQTARAKDNDHKSVLEEFRNMTFDLLSKNFI